MITWLAIKGAMSSALAWCKERWELLVGVLVGILGMIALRGGKSNDTSQHLEEELEARKEFQEKTKEHIFFKKRKKTIISSARGTQTKYLEKAEEIIPKPKQAYITINRGTKRVLIDIN